MPEDDFLIFYRFGENAKYLNSALEKQAEMINNSVKKPFLPYNFTSLRQILGRDSGQIDEEDYEIFVTPNSPVLNVKQLEVIL